MAIKQWAEVTIVREEWATYRLVENGTIIKSKNSLATFQFDPETKQAEGKFAATYAVVPAKDDQGTPSEDIRISPQDIVGEPSFEIVHESVNIYDVPKQKLLILLKPHLEKVAKTKKFDAQGVRIFQLNFALALANIPYPPDSPTSTSDES